MEVILLEISREFVRTVVFVLGPMVLASYVVGLRRADDPMALWGGIPESWRTANAMIAAVILLDNLIDTGYVAREIENPIAREPIFIFLNFAFSWLCLHD